MYTSTTVAHLLNATSHDCRSTVSHIRVGEYDLAAICYTVYTVYSGTLASNGGQFDSSHKRGRPFTFTIGVGQVIRGWDEGVMQMSLGEKAMLHITSDYGYGAQGAGGVIPPNADLNFEVHLMQIN